MAEKEFYSNIKLISSVIKDEDGLQISLTNDERESIHQAYGGPATASNPVVTKTQYDADIAAIKTGLRWQPPVNTLSATAPLTPVIGDRYINTTDHLLYTCTVAGNWGTGADPLENWTVFAKDTDEEWTYDLQTTTWIEKSSGAIPMASTITPGKVQLATDGESSSGKVVQSNDHRLVKGYYGATISNPTGTIVVDHELGSTKLLITTWGPNGVADVSISRNVADPTNKIDIGVNGSPASLEIYIIALP